ncbi:hypothetical protein BXZ70DRAFT_213958 [Cristinia sonorae]|uniref:Yeast cell wall synthesis Kre9/Knh1-like N-terminal domain-containing protein n=1 Tax=Cristinia sonorae TaxID=1940300 RepID=A0A8K0UN60_9AGAR|nr:hypothetical protein BXZ70DRAFT_213958 [Cristinia sonorae]
MLALYSAVALLASSAAATIVIQTPTNATSAFPITVSWTSDVSDPSSFTLELNNPVLFNQALAVGNNLDTSLGSVSFTMPTVQADNRYQFLAVNVSNINQVFGQSGTFSIAVVSVSSTSTPSSIGSSSTVSLATPSLTATLSTTSGSSTPATTGSGTSTTGTGTQTSPPPTPFNGNGNTGAAESLAMSWMSWALSGAAAVFGGVLAL